MPLRGVCPEGWHLPSTAEWVQLVKNVGETIENFPVFYYFATPLVSTAAGKWMHKDGLNVSGTNTSGFNAIPTRIRNFEGKTPRGLSFIIVDQNNPDYSEGKVRCIKD